MAADFRYFKNGDLPVDGLWHCGRFGQLIKTEPWNCYMPWFRIAPHVYQVSGYMNNGSYLIDTGEGLILVDAPQFEMLYLQFESIRNAGFDPKDIKQIWITHSHGDHFNAARAIHEYTGADIVVGRDCWIGYKERMERGSLGAMPCPPISQFEPDKYFEDMIPFSMGRFKFDMEFHNGHCRGSLVFFFDDTDEETGKTYRVGMHGGIGECGMWNVLQAGDPVEHYYQYINECRELAKLDVDITLYSHENQINAHTAVNPDDPMDYSEFVNRDVWRNLMNEKADDCERRSDPNDKGSFAGNKQEMAKKAAEEAAAKEAGK